MFSDATRTAVLALVTADSCATPDERRAVADALRGLVPVRSSSSCDGLVISFTEAARRLGARNPQFARNLAKAGKIKSVYGSGKGLRPYGVTAKSVEDFALEISGGAKSA